MSERVSDYLAGWTEPEPRLPPPGPRRRSYLGASPSLARLPQLELPSCIRDSEPTGIFSSSNFPVTAPAYVLTNRKRYIWIRTR